MRKHNDFPITFASWYQCNRLDEISSGIEDLVGGIKDLKGGIKGLEGHSKVISQGAGFNICKALGYEILGPNVSEGEAYVAGKLKIEEEARRKEEEQRARDLEFWKRMEEQRKISKAARQREEEEKKNSPGCAFILFVVLPGILAAVAGLALLMRAIFFAACDAASGLYSLICSNIFFIALFLIPSTIIFVGHKIESKKKQNKHIK